MEIEVRNTGIGEIIYHKKNHIYYWHREDGPAFTSGGDKREWWYYYDINYMDDPSNMPLNLFLAYVKWELKKHGKL
jgi:hypothetical protein